MSHKVWIIDDDYSIRWVLERALSTAGIATSCYENGDRALDDFYSEQPDVVISDICMPGTDGFKVLQRFQSERPHLPIIIMTAHSDLDSAVAAYQGGAFEYLPKPFDIDEVLAVTRRALAHAGAPLNSEPPLLPADRSSKEIIGEAAAMQEVFRAIGRLSHSNVTVLIGGQTGTGKELVAEALHQHSPRKNKPFIALNMAAIPQDLIESELFGHEKGAFTGAATQRCGRFEQANGGTLFLDEIGDMPADIQARLLRVLANGEFYRVGGQRPLKVNVRIITATHQDLQALVQQGKFREDLWHRLNVIHLQIPRLADRREDIPRLAHHFLNSAAKELGVEVKILHKQAEDYLTGLDWPGNVRQLQNSCRWITVMAAGREVHIEDLPPELIASGSARQSSPDWQKALQLWADQALASGRQQILSEALPAFEATLIDIALKHSAGKKSDAAQLLGWGRNTLSRKIKELKLSATDANDPAQASG